MGGSCVVLIAMARCTKDDLGYDFYIVLFAMFCGAGSCMLGLVVLVSAGAVASGVVAFVAALLMDSGRPWSS